MNTATGQDAMTSGVEARQWPELLAGWTAPEMVNTLFNITYILLVGLVLWSLLLKGRTEEEWRRQRRWTMNMLRLYVLALLASAALFVFDTVGFDDPLHIGEALLHSTAGFSWLLLLGSALLGLVFLHRIKPFDALWLLVVVLAKTQLGHAADVGDRTIASLMTGIHILAASLWAGGLLLILLLWRRYRYDAERLLPTLSGAALAALMLLATTGLVNSIIYLPDLSYVTETRWGLFLLWKLGLVLLLVVIAALVRRRYARSGTVRLGGLLRIELALMVVVIVLGASMSGADPVPGDAPLQWQAEEDGVAISAGVSPNSSGVNTFTLTVSLPERAGAPSNIDMRVLSGQPQAEPTVIALQPAELADGGSSAAPGFADYYYEADSAAISGLGEWVMQVTVLLDDGGERVFEQMWFVYR